MDITSALESDISSLVKPYIVKDGSLVRECNAVTLHVLFEKFYKQRNSFWDPYLSLIPDSFSLPISFSPFEWSLVSGSPSARHLATDARSKFEALKVELVSQFMRPNPHIFGSASPAVEAKWERELAWAFSAFTTREYRRRVAGDSRCSLVPLADLMNHKHGAHMLEHYPSPTESAAIGGYVQRVSQAVAAGEQLVAGYDPPGERVMCNVHYLAHYGFAVPPSPPPSPTERLRLPAEEDCVNLALSFPRPTSATATATATSGSTAAAADATGGEEPSLASAARGMLESWGLLSLETHADAAPAVSAPVGRGYANQQNTQAVPLEGTAAATAAAATAAAAAADSLFSYLPRSIVTALRVKALTATDYATGGARRVMAGRRASHAHELRAFDALSRGVQQFLAQFPATVAEDEAALRMGALRLPVCGSGSGGRQLADAAATATVDAQGSSSSSSLGSSGGGGHTADAPGVTCVAPASSGGSGGSRSSSSSRWVPLSAVARAILTVRAGEQRVLRQLQRLTDDYMRSIRVDLANATAAGATTGSLWSEGAQQSPSGDSGVEVLPPTRVLTPNGSPITAWLRVLSPSHQSTAIIPPPTPKGTSLAVSFTLVADESRNSAHLTAMLPQLKVCAAVQTTQRGSDPTGSSASGGSASGGSEGGSDEGSAAAAAVLGCLPMGSGTLGLSNLPEGRHTLHLWLQQRLHTPLQRQHKQLLAGVTASPFAASTAAADGSGGAPVHNGPPTVVEFRSLPTAALSNASRWWPATVVAIGNPAHRSVHNQATLPLHLGVHGPRGEALPLSPRQLGSLRLCLRLVSHGEEFFRLPEDSAHIGTVTSLGCRALNAAIGSLEGLRLGQYTLTATLQDGQGRELACAQSRFYSSRLPPSPPDSPLRLQKQIALSGAAHSAANALSHSPHWLQGGTDGTTSILLSRVPEQPTAAPSDSGDGSAADTTAAAAVADLARSDWPRYLSQGYWRSLCPALHIQHPWGEEMWNRSIDVSLRERRRMDAGLLEDAYFHSRVLDWRLPVPMPLMADCVRRLRRHRWPAVFAFVFDEFWMLGSRMNSLLEHWLGEELLQMPDFWAFHVHPTHAEEAGWRPHRDRTHSASYIPLLPDGRPASLNLWIPLTPADAHNGCMYCVPKQRDVHYGSPDDVITDSSIADIDFQNIRALHALPGEILGWDGQLLHWGSRSNPRATHDRISVAYEYQRGDQRPMNWPLLPKRFNPGWADRLRLLGKQAANYKHIRETLKAGKEDFIMQLPSLAAGL